MYGIDLEGSATHPIPDEVRDKVNVVLSEVSDKLNLR
jgi:hypothetical protein